MSAPQISILVPMRNAQAFIESALRSILAQRGIELEIIVVDNGSTDCSKEIVRGINDPRLRLIDCTEPGISATFNAGLAEARAPLLARCDADDLFVPDRLLRQSNWLHDHPDYIATCGSFVTITPSGKPAGEPRFATSAEDITPELLNGITRTHLCTYLMRTDTLRQIGGCRPWFKTAEDLDLQFRLAEAGNVFYEPIVCYQYRVHDESITHQQPNAQRQFFADCAASFLKERRATGADPLQRNSPPLIPEAGAGERHSSSIHLQKLLVGTAWDQHARGQKRDAICTGLRACFIRPQALSAWKSLTLLVMKSSRSPK